MKTALAKDYAAERTTLMDKLKLSIVPEFVPFSQCRNKKDSPKPGDLSVNWSVTLMRGDREVITTDYMQGIGHIRGYKFQFNKVSMDEFEGLKRVCETGLPVRVHASPPHQFYKVTPPTREDFIYSLIMDAGVLDYTSFEEWAVCIGYNPDSRKDEKVYRECLKIALALRVNLGGSNLEALREAFQDF